MGDSDDEASGFDGFTSNDISKKGKSDIALDLVINNDHLLMKFDLESDSGASKFGVQQNQSLDS